MHGETWPDEDIELLKRLWAQGETAASIAAKLGGMSRSAVLGKIFRLRLPPNVGKTPGAAGTKASGQRAAPPRRRGPHGDTFSPAPAAKGRYGKTLLELTNRCCRFPYVPPPQMAV